MTILESLDKYYYRLLGRGHADPPGYSRESISFCIWLNPDGSIYEVEDLRDHSGQRPLIRRMRVPQAVIRTSGILSNFLWDKTSYVLGVTTRTTKRTGAEHAAFKALNLSWIANSDDEGLNPLSIFLTNWTPATFYVDPHFVPDMLDKNIVFGLADGGQDFLHERLSIQSLIASKDDAHWKLGRCLITGENATVARLHPPIKGVYGAQVSGARLVSFGSDAFTSYGAENGANAPISEAVAFGYGTALNYLLNRESRNHVQIGDATLVYWADSEGVGEEAASNAEYDFGTLIEPPIDGETEKIRHILREIERGRPRQQMDSRIDPRIQFHVLCLNPNAGRLSVRYWLTSELDHLTKALTKHIDDVAIEPAPWTGRLPSIRYLLVRTTALMERIENIPVGLISEMTRAVLEGTPYPRVLLSAAVARLRAGDSPRSGWHAAIIKAYINRSEKEKLPVTRTPDFPATSYQLGRLFAVLGAAQYAALGRVNSSITDRYFRSASATPARIFGSLLSNIHNHIHAANKHGKGLWIEARLNEIMERLPPEIPSSLSLVDQGRFVLGYYHERSWREEGQVAAELDVASSDKEPA